VPPDSPYKTLKDLQNADKIRFAISGVGSSSWISAVFAKEILKIPVHIVSGYAGSSQFIVAVIKGEADVVSTGDINTELRYVRAGELRPVVVFTLKPSDYAPEVPHLGGTPFELMARLTPFDRVVAAPPGVPEDRLQIIESAFMKAVNDEDFLGWAKKAKRPVKPIDAKGTTDVVKSLIKLYSEYSKKIKLK
jgi:tripartite-type tricarboxylate transporter receptor subunit TctC